MIENKTVEGMTIDDTWLSWLELLNEDGNKNQDSRDGKVYNEVINAITIIKDPTRGIMTNNIRRMSMRYAVGEMLWYNSGNNSLKGINKYTQAWKGLSDDGLKANSNYGWCIKNKYYFDQMEFVKKLLHKDINTRQAVIHIKEPRDTFESPTADVNCTVCLQFIVRNNKLYMTTYMRSNDLWLGFPFDIFNFTNMQVQLAMELDLELGSYTHIAGSLHLYQRDKSKIDKRKEEMNG